MKKLLALGLSLTLALSAASFPALADSPETTSAPAQSVSAWAYDDFGEASALGLWTGEYASVVLDPVTTEQLSAMTDLVADKLALLKLNKRTVSLPDLVMDSTRGSVVEALYDEAAVYQLSGVDKGAVSCLTALGVVKGVGAGNLALEKPCSLQEAVVMATRLVLAVYDQCDAGSKGLLWKAAGNGNTLYLLGTIHVDRGDVYPFHKSLRSVITSAEKVYLELDFGDAAGLSEFTAMQLYSDGTTLKDHISADLFSQVAAAFAPLGLTGDAVAQYKPWALANSLTTLAGMDDSTGGTFVAVDTYVYSKAVNNGIPSGGIETYALQGNIFDSLSASYQTEYLKEALDLYNGASTASGSSSDYGATLDSYLNAWKSGDAAAFVKAYDKAAVISSSDELAGKLFTARDPGMIKSADALLKTSGSHTYLLAVGAGHMVDPGGIVSGLKALGYTVEQVK